jgi:hypothetical protein
MKFVSILRKIKSGWTSLIAATVMVASSSSSDGAVTFYLTPVSQTVPVGSSVSVELWVSGLTGTGPGVDLGDWAVQISYDDTIVSNTSNSFGTGLGSSLQSDFSVSGLIDMDEVSFEGLAFFASQADSFRLATFNFDADSVGITDLSFVVDPPFVPRAGDATGAEIPLETVGARIAVTDGGTTVPESMGILPAAMAFALCCLAGARLRRLKDAGVGA